MKLEDLTFETAKRYLMKNMPTEKIENVFQRRNQWKLRNPLMELMKTNVGLHNSLVDRSYDDWGYLGELHIPLIAEYMICENIPPTAKRELDYYTYINLSEFAEPMIDIMKTSPSLRKTCLQELKRHMVYHAMDRIGEMQFRNNYFGVEKDDVMNLMKSAIKFDYALKLELGKDV